MLLARVTIIIALTFISACSSYVEELASEQFLPVIPEPSDEEKIVDGAIYSNKSQGFFVTERKASEVGDIVTISLNESLLFGILINSWV